MVPRADYLSSTKRARLPVLYLDFGLVPRTPHSDFLHWNPILYTPYIGVCALDSAPWSQYAGLYYHPVPALQWSHQWLFPSPWRHGWITPPLGADETPGRNEKGAPTWLALGFVLWTFTLYLAVPRSALCTLYAGPWTLLLAPDFGLWIRDSER